MKHQTAALVTSALCLLGASQAQAAIPDTAKLYKSPNCMCCDGYARHLESKGMEVEVIKTSRLGQAKANAGIPHDHSSCHTVVMGDYLIEGHVPFAAVEKLFDEEPNVKGIALGGMPSGTPGMPGPKRQPYNVVSFGQGEVTPFVTL